MGANYSQQQMVGPRPQLVSNFLILLFCFLKAYCIKCKEARLTEVKYVDNQNKWNGCICFTFIWIFYTLWISFFVLYSLEGLTIIYAMALMLMLAFGLGMLFVPICIILFLYKDIKHYCTHCEAYVGTFNPYNRRRNMMYYW